MITGIINENGTFYSIIKYEVKLLQINFKSYFIYLR